MPTHGERDRPLAKTATASLLGATGAGRVFTAAGVLCPIMRSFNRKKKKKKVAVVIKTGPRQSWVISSGQEMTQTTCPRGVNVQSLKENDVDAQG